MPSGGRGEHIPLEIQGRAGRVEGMLIYNSEATFRKAKFSKGGSPEFRDVVECLRVKVLGSITRYFKNIQSR